MPVPLEPLLGFMVYMQCFAGIPKMHLVCEQLGLFPTPNRPLQVGIVGRSIYYIFWISTGLKNIPLLHHGRYKSRHLRDR